MAIVLVVLRIAGTYRVPIAGLLRLLGIEPKLLAGRSPGSTGMTLHKLQDMLQQEIENVASYAGMSHILVGRVKEGVEGTGAK